MGRDRSQVRLLSAQIRSPSAFLRLKNNHIGRPDD